MSEANATIVRRCFEAYAAKDRALWQSLVADDFRFTSPYDNRIDRAAFLSRCWPTGNSMAKVRFERLQAFGDTVFVTYIGQHGSGAEFTNTEIFTVRDGLVHEIEVYFGWNLPHPAAPVLLGTGIRRSYAQSRTVDVR